MKKQRFWRGKKRIAKKYYPRHLWLYFMKNGLPEVGDLTHDCDGYNYEITEIEWSWVSPMIKFRPVGLRKAAIRRCPTKILLFLPTEVSRPSKEPGDTCWICPCMGPSFQIPESAEKIRAWIMSWDCPEGKETIKNWDFTSLTEDIENIRAGRPTVDERGVRV